MMTVQNTMPSESQTSLFPISAIILTHNEQTNIHDCLECLTWAEDIILVDSGSVDDTLRLATDTRPDIRIFNHAFRDFGDQRNWALDHAGPHCDWILFVDADERITPECTAALRAAVLKPGNKVGFYLCPRNYFQGRWIKRCAMYPSWQLRLLKNGLVRFRKEGHGQREVTDGPLGYVYEPYDHYGFSKGIDNWIQRHNQYASNEAELILRLRKEPLQWKSLFIRNPVQRRRFLKRLAAGLPCRPLARFVYLYLFRLGFLDGRPGFVFSKLRASHEANIQRKLRKLRSGRANPPGM